MIAVGIALGLYYTWVVNPVKFVDATFYDLRQDYKADYVLMTAEIFGQDPALFQTILRLDRLMSESPEQAVSDAIKIAENLGYAETDLDLLYKLNAAIGGSSEEGGSSGDFFIEYVPPATAEPDLDVPVEVDPFEPVPVENNPFPTEGNDG